MSPCIRQKSNRPTLTRVVTRHDNRELSFSYFYELILQSLFKSIANYVGNIFRVLFGNKKKTIATFYLSKHLRWRVKFNWILKILGNIFIIQIAEKLFSVGTWNFVSFSHLYWSWSVQSFVSQCVFIAKLSYPKVGDVFYESPDILEFGNEAWFLTMAYGCNPTNEEHCLTYDQLLQTKPY